MKKVNLTSPFDYIPRTGGKPVRGMRTIQPGEHKLPDAAADEAVAKGVGTLVEEPVAEGIRSPEPAPATPAQALATETVTRKR